MQTLVATSATRSHRLPTASLLAGAALSLLAAHSGCRGGDNPADTGMDLSVPSDMAKPAGSIQDVTIRDLNSPNTKLKDGDRVRLSGVVISPRNWITSSAGNSDWCDYRIFLMQADGSPSTIRDGVAVILSLKTTFTDMSRLSDCSRVAQADAVATAMTAAKQGDLLQIEGTMSHHGSGASATRQVDVYKGVINNHGAAQMMPVPVDADPMTYTPQMVGLAPAFADAQGVLVTFRNVKTNSRDTMYQDFNASTGDTGGARIEASYLRAADNMYMGPADGSMLKSVTGIVTGDYKGTIWPRSPADIVQ
jgi:hypothetical protein